jgi:hypothetical protein
MNSSDSDYSSDFFHFIGCQERRQMAIPELRRFTHTIRSTFSYLEVKYMLSPFKFNPVHFSNETNRKHTHFSSGT